MSDVTMLVLKVLNDPVVQRPTLFLGLEMDLTSILDFFKDADNILIEKKNGQRLVYIESPEFSCRFVEMENY